MPLARRPTNFQLRPAPSDWLAGLFALLGALLGCAGDPPGAGAAVVGHAGQAGQPAGGSPVNGGTSSAGAASGAGASGSNGGGAGMPGGHEGGAALIEGNHKVGDAPRLQAMTATWQTWYDSVPH